MYMLNYQNIISAMLDFVPEIRDDYALMKKECLDGGALWDAQDYRDMGSAYTTGKSFEEMHTPDVSTVFEDLIVPLILALSCDAEGSSRLIEIMNWLEEASADSDVANAIAVSVCESLITTHVSKIEAIYPYMGKRVRDMCIMQFSEYHISEATKRIFGVA